MASNAWSDSHLSTPGSGKPQETEGVRQHHRMALGQKLSGQTDPNGNTPKANLIKNNQGKTY